jgi:outer membrane receptor protein involved in Fe transport
MIIRNLCTIKALRNLCAGQARMFGLLLTFAMLLGLSPASAQTITATVRGTIMDPSGAVLAGASVTAINTATNVKTGTVTNEDGNYNIQFLPIGQYKITVAAPGFETSSIGPFMLEIDQIARIDTKLKVGKASDTVSVSSDVSPIMQTEDATVESTLSGNALSSMPLNGLNFQSATLYVAGAVNPSMSSMAAGDGNERDTSAAGSPSFNGNRAQTNNYVLDGIEINETMNNLSGYNPAPDAIQEMRVITGNASAEYGNVNGGEVLVVTKGGTNQFHGSAYELYQANYMAANSWNNGYLDVQPSAFTQDQFGGTFGGPVRIPHVFNGKDKLFFFADYLGFRYHSGGQAKATVPTVDMRTCPVVNGVATCDFSELWSQQFNFTQLYNNQNGNGFANATPYGNCAANLGNLHTMCNQIPLVSPMAKFLFANPNALPLPNTTPLLNQGDSSNYLGYSKGQTHNNQEDYRVDWKAGVNDAVMGRYTQGEATDFTAHTVLPTSFASDNIYPFKSFVTNWVHNFSPAIVNEFRAGITRSIWDQSVPEDPTGIFGADGNKVIGLPMPNQPFPGFSKMSIGSSESNMGSAAVITEFHENNFYYGDNLTWQHGAHIFKYGAQILRYQQNIYYAGNAGALGTFSYSGAYTVDTSSKICGATGTKSCGGYGYADLVMDESNGTSIGGVSGNNGQRQYRNAFYAQDDWKFNSKLTLNLGVRYGHDQPIYEVNNKEASVDLSNMNLISTTGIELAGVNGNSRSLYNAYNLEFMPRVGFSYQVEPRIVLRGGYGITDDLEGTGENFRMVQNPPFQNNFSASPTPPQTTSSGQPPLLLETGFNQPLGSAKVSYSTYNAWDPNLKPALIQQFNLAVQYLIDSKTSVQAGYVGETGQHLVTPIYANQWTTKTTGTLANADCSNTIAPAAPACNLVGNQGQLQLTRAEGFSNYNSMQATVRHQNSNGLEYTFNYTWARAMTDNAGFYGVSSVSDSSSFYQDFRNPRGDYGPAGQDVRQAFNGHFNYQLPFGRGEKFGAKMNRVLDDAVGGWKVSGGVVMYSGFPLNMVTPTEYIIHNGHSHAMQYRPMKIVNRSVHNWFGTDPSAVPCTSLDPVTGNAVDNGTCAYGYEGENSFGNAPNGSERAPGFRQVDLAASKAFHLTGAQTLLLRGEAFNALNLASYAAPVNTLSSSLGTTFGRITATNSSQRIMQVTLHYQF